MSDWPMWIQYTFFLGIMTIFYLLVIEIAAFVVKKVKRKS